MNKNKFNFWFDVVLFVLFLVTIISLFGTKRTDALDQEPFILQTRVVVHSVAGALMLMGSAVHIALHWEWIQAVVMRSPKELAKRVRAKRGMDIRLFVLAILCGVTGMMALLMQGFLSNPCVLSLRAWSGLHRLTGTVMFVIVLVHLAQHWKWIVSTTRRCLKIGGSKQQLPHIVAETSSVLLNLHNCQFTNTLSTVTGNQVSSYSSPAAGILALVNERQGFRG